MKVTSSTTRRPQCVVEIVALHQLVHDAIESGTVEALQPDPMYPRAHLFDDGTVLAIVRKIEKNLYQFEIDRYPGYHRDAQGVQNNEVLVTPGFDQLPLSAQRFLVLGMDEIYQRYKAS